MSTSQSRKRIPVQVNLLPAEHEDFLALASQNGMSQSEAGARCIQAALRKGKIPK